MCKNIIYYFSGTGNSLQVSNKIAHTLESCEIQCMTNETAKTLENTYETIGFIYPTYFQGIPNIVNDFISKLDLTKQKSAYIYAITTYGGFVGNGLSQTNQLLNDKGANLHYAKKLKMFSNYIVMYKMSNKIEKTQAKSIQNLNEILNDIRNKKENNHKMKKPNFILNQYYKWRIKQISDMDTSFTVSSDCISCGICQCVCPVKNIDLSNGHPTFKHHCEQCMACIQYCPKEAINYKDKTQNRGRYTNPSINWKELSSSNQKEV